MTIVYSWRSFAQAQWYWLPRVERFDWPRAGISVRWLCGLWYVFT